MSGHRRTQHSNYRNHEPKKDIVLINMVAPVQQPGAAMVIAVNLNEVHARRATLI